jgi:hypothetical protein
LHLLVVLRSEDMNRIWTQTPYQWQLLGTQTQVIAWKALLGIQKRDAACCLGQNVLLLMINQRYEPTLAVKSKGGELRKSSEGRIVSKR